MLYTTQHIIRNRHVTLYIMLYNNVQSNLLFVGYVLMELYPIARPIFLKSTVNTPLFQVQWHKIIFKSLEILKVK